MVTGYTAKLAESGESFEAFVIRCAHAFTVHDEPIPARWKVDPYHRVELKKAKDGIRRIKRLSEEDCEKEARAWFRKLVEERNASKKKAAAAKGRLEGMKARVSEWTPPTEDHKELKKFMLQQLTSSIEHGDIEYDEVPEACSGRDWKADTLGDLHRSVEYHEKELGLEAKRVEKLNRWIGALRRSLRRA
jgi:hypothetical protein